MTLTNDMLTPVSQRVRYVSYRPVTRDPDLAKRAIQRATDWRDAWELRQHSTPWLHCVLTLTPSRSRFADMLVPIG